MNNKTKRRMMAVAGVVVIVIIVLLAVVGGNSAAKVVSVKDVAAGSYVDKKVQVSGLVVANSYSVNEVGVLIFDIEDEDGKGATAHVSYDKGVSATFGNGIKAICTGRVDASGTVVCSDLVTQCPSKYEKATDALGVSQLLDYGANMFEKTTKVAGTVQAGTLGDATQAVRFVVKDAENADQLSIVFEGALSDQVKEGAQVVITGALSSDGSKFLATDVALSA